MPTGIRLPLELPLVTRTSHGDTFEEIRKAFEPEIGVIRRRNRMRVAPRIFDCQLELSQDEYSLFDNWWQDVIKGGERDFDIQLLDDDYTLVWYTVHVIGEYTAEVIDPMDWRVSFRVKALGDSFGPIRGSGTDELGGRVTVGVSNPLANIRVYAPFYGRVLPEVTPTAKLNVLPLYGNTDIGMYSLPRGVLNEIE